AEPCGEEWTSCAVIHVYKCNDDRQAKKRGKAPTCCAITRYTSGKGHLPLDQSAMQPKGIMVTIRTGGEELLLIVLDEIQTFASYLPVVQSSVRHAVWPCPELRGMLPHPGGVCTQCLTILPQHGTDYAHFLEGLLQQIGHLHKGLLLGETVPWSCGLYMQCQALSLDGVKPRLDLLGGDRLLWFLG